MVDWFVLLIPLVLLPIILLFGYVGCVLDRAGGASPIDLRFPGTIFGTVSTINVSLKVDEEGSTTLSSPKNTPVTAASANPAYVGSAGINIAGTVTCSCSFTPPGAPPVSLSKPKIECEPSPQFELTSGFTLI